MRARFRGAANNGTFTRFFRCALNTETKMQGGKTIVLQCPLKTLPQLARSGYLFSCFITGVNWYKIGHEKRINKVLFRASICCKFAVLARRAQTKKHVEQLKF